jgi:hypothetical protein
MLAIGYLVEYDARPERKAGEQLEPNGPYALTMQDSMLPELEHRINRQYICRNR